MNGMLLILLRIAGAGLLLLAAVHVPIGRHLKWREDAARLAPANAAVFHVHTLFVCLVLVLMALPCLLDPAIFLERTRAGAWLAWSFAAFWLVRLYCQWFVFPRSLWQGRPLETRIHFIFTAVWLALTAVFAICGCRQSGLLSF